MKRARLTHEVWMGFPDYEGNIYSVSVIARFCSKQRACDYLKLILEEHPYKDEHSPRYGYKESGENEFVQIANLYDDYVDSDGKRKTFLSSFVRMGEDTDGFGYIPTSDYIKLIGKGAM